MSTPADLLPRARPALLYLLRLAREGGGYEWRDVRGWARVEEIAAVLRERDLRDLLSSVQRRTGWLTREDVAHPARTAPVWVYRITPEGAREADGDALPHLPLPLAGAARRANRFFLLPSLADALGVLQYEAQRPTAPEYVAGEAGWLLTEDVTERTERLGAGRRARPEDLHLLARAGLAEPRRIVLPGQRRARFVHRVTARGREAFPLSWQEPGGPTPRVQPRVPLPSATARGR